MKKFLATLAVLSVVCCALFALCACDRVNPNDGNDDNSDQIAGIISQQSYSSEEAAINGFLADEISGEAATAQLTEYNVIAELKASSVPSDMLSDGERAVTVKQVQITYTRSNAINADASSDSAVNPQTYSYTLYVITVARGASSQQYRYIVPAYQQGNEMTRSYFESIFDPAKYTNCTQTIKTTVSIIANGGDAQLTTNATGEEVIAIDGNKMLYEIHVVTHMDGMVFDDETVEMYITIYAEYDETTQQLTYWHKDSADGQFVKGETDSEMYGQFLIDPNEFSKIYLPALDFSFFENTSYGFALRNEFVGANMQRFLGQTIGDIDIGYGNDLLITLSAQAHVDNNRLSKIVTSMQCGLQNSEPGIQVGTLTTEDIEAEFGSFGTTVVNRPEGITD